MILDEKLFETTLGDTIADYDQEQALERVEDDVDNKKQIEKFKKYMLPETILNYLYDYKYSDIASVLGISEARVRDHVRKNISELSKFLRYRTQPSPYLLKVEEQNKDVDLEKILSKGKPSEASLEESKKSEIKSEIKSAQGEIDYIKKATETAKSHLETIKANKDQYLPDPSDKRYDELLDKYEQLIKGFEETVEAGEKIISEIKRKSSIKEDYEKSDKYTVITQPDTNEEKFDKLEDALKYFEEEVEFLKNKENLGEKKSVELINKNGRQVKYWEEDVKLEEELSSETKPLKELLPNNFDSLPKEERVKILTAENSRKELLTAVNRIGELINSKNPWLKNDWKIIKNLLRDNNLLKEDLSQEEQQEYGLNTLINELIKSEYDAIDEYNSAIVTLEAENQGEYTDVIRSIIEDERHHIGNLQEIMNRITPGTEQEFEKGKEEAIDTLDEEPKEETTTTIDTEEGVIKTYKLDKVEDMKGE